MATPGTPTRELPSGAMFHPIWLFRVLPALAAAAVLLAMTLFKAEPLHSACLGFAAGLLITLAVVGFQIENVTLRQSPAPSDVEHHRLTQ